jgi:hypothetical protein
LFGVQSSLRLVSEPPGSPKFSSRDRRGSQSDRTRSGWAAIRPDVPGRASAAPQKGDAFMSLEARIRELSERHKRLDAAIAAELKHPAGDDMRIHDLKRKKLRIKDELMTLRTN